MSEIYTVPLSRGQLIDPVVTMPVNAGVGETLVAVADVDVVWSEVVGVGEDEVLEYELVQHIHMAEYRLL